MPEWVDRQRPARFWGQVFETCPYFAKARRRDRNVDIVVPPTSISPNSDYVVIGRSLATPTFPETIYSQRRSRASRPAKLRGFCSTRSAPSTANACLQGLEDTAPTWGSCSREYYDWTLDQEQYPFISSRKRWDVATSIAPPNGFVPDTTSLSTNVADCDRRGAVHDHRCRERLDADQRHPRDQSQGTTRIRTDAVRMFQQEADEGQARFHDVLPNTTGNVIDVLPNDNVAPPKTLTITAVTQGAKAP